MSKDGITFPFQSQSSQEWRSQVEKELKGKAFEDYLIWEFGEDLNIDSWQDTRPSPLPELVPLDAPCQNIAYIVEQDAQKANMEAHNALMNGAEGIWFAKSFQGAAFEVASKNIDTSIAPVFARKHNLFDPYGTFLKTSEELDSIGSETILIDGSRYRERGCSPEQEIGLMIAQGLHCLRSRIEDGKIQFLTGIGTSYLIEISKIRAIRWLWTQILQHEGRAESNPDLLGTNLLLSWTKNDPYTNVLRSTSSAMAGNIGGVQGIVIKPWNLENTDSSFSSRVSRNIQNLLRDESRLDKNLNPADGSYFIEHLTCALAERAWNYFRSIESNGGFVKHARSGALKKELEHNRAELIRKHNEERHILLGVNKFPPKEIVPEAPASSSEHALLPPPLQLSYEIQNAR